MKADVDCSTDTEALLGALADAEYELRAAGSRLDLPGAARFRLLVAAHRTEHLIEAAAAASELRGVP